MVKEIRSHGKGGKRTPAECKTVPITPEVLDILDELRQRFIEKFGREPGPDDPLLFDPDKDTPTQLDPDALIQEFEAAADAAGLNPAISYAFRKTGLIVTEENQHLLSQEDLEEWQQAIEEGLRLFRPQ